jgi:beta-phosphoglucomutase-like phosphatase (HAD superfamily)
MDFVLTRADYTQSKPHPEPYLTAMDRHDLRPVECIVVEDSERGLASATAAGVECIIVLSEWTRDGDFTKAEAVVENISGVPEELLR